MAEVPHTHDSDRSADTCPVCFPDDLPQAAIDAAAEVIDAEFRAIERSRPRWSRDLAIAAVEAAAPHLVAAEQEREAQLDHCPGCAHRYGTCDCDCCAHVQRAVAAERERWRAALKDATEGMEEMLPYVSEYFRDKWDLPAYIARARATLAQMGDGDGR